MLKLSFSNLFRRVSRTALSLLGIAIGVAAIIVLVSLVNGVQYDFENLLSNIQAVFVMEKDSIDQTLSYLDADLKESIEKVPGIRTVLPEVWRVPNRIEGKTVSLGFSSPVALYGVDLTEFTKLKQIPYSLRLYSGRWLKNGDLGKAVIGKKFADDYHKFVGSSLKIEGKKFRVVGIYDADSEMYENFIMMGEQDIRDTMSFPNDKVSDFYIELTSPELDKEVADQLNFLFSTELDAYSMSDFSDSLGGAFENLSLVSFFVAGISAVVAGIGIINTILMSVMERKKEIGSLKAVGWTDNDVAKMILYESLLLGIIGGIIGLIIGSVLAKTIEANVGITALISIELVLQAFFFAVILGVGAGLYPAYTASKLAPIDALRG